MYFILKTIISALLIAAISTISKKYTTIGAIVASLPLTSILAFIWLFQETKDAEKVVELSYSIIWILIPSIVFFIILPFMLKKNYNFYLSLVISCVIMCISYYGYVVILRHLGIKI